MLIVTRWRSGAFSTPTMAFQGADHNLRALMNLYLHEEGVGGRRVGGDQSLRELPVASCCRYRLREGSKL